MQSVLVIVLIVALALDVILMAFSALSQDRKRALCFSALTVALCFYTLGYMVEIMAETREAAFTALRFENAGIALMGPLFLLTVASLFYGRHIRPFMLPLALGYGFVMFLIVFFNESHHLYYASLEMVSYGANKFARMDRGILFYMQQAISMGLTLFGYVLLFRRFILIGRIQRMHMAFFMAGSAVPLIANLLYLSGVFPVGFDPMPIAMTLGLGVISIDMFKYRMMDIVTLSSNQAVETMDDALLVLDMDSCYLRSNQSAVALFPQLASFHGGEPIVSVSGWPAEMMAAMEAGQFTFSRPQGSAAVTYRATVSKIRSAAGAQIGWTVVIRDISDMTRLLDRLSELATTDPLTGILNRREFVAVVNRELEDAARHGMYTEMIILDLDAFKRVNDTYGHAAGDHVLREVVDAVRTQLRTHDVFARYGGEEFAIFCTSGQERRSLSLAPRLCAAIAGLQIVFEGVQIPVTASFGAVKVYPGVSFDQAMRAADDALYRAKQSGRNQVVTDIARA